MYKRTIPRLGGMALLILRMVNLIKTSPHTLLTYKYKLNREHSSVKQKPHGAA
jgi:hypothetical protein